MRAILLAAGLGTRLRPLTNNVPKCLLLIKEKPLLEILLKQLIESDIGPFLIKFKKKDLYKIIPSLHLTVIPLILIQFVVILVISINKGDATWTFTQIRMSAPATFVFCLIPIVFVYNCLERKKYIGKLETVIYSHFIVLSCYYFPKFFVSDIF